MNKEDAQKILREELQYFENKSYAELAEQVGENLSYEKETPEGRSYQLEILILWDSKPEKAIRVIASIDDGGWRAFFPLTDSILKLPPE
jgi:hypothetical protein